MLDGLTFVTPRSSYSIKYLLSTTITSTKILLHQTLNAKHEGMKIFNHQTYFSVMIITGGKTTHGTDEPLVELLDEHGKLICSLPNLPDERFGHTQTGLMACGGGNKSHSISTCLTFQNGSWIYSYMTEARFSHSSWKSPNGVMLLGGKMIHPLLSSEILTEDGEWNSSFDLHYKT